MVQQGKLLRSDRLFIVRNAGNMVPHSSKVSASAVATEPAVLELACVINTVSSMPNVYIYICGYLLQEINRPKIMAVTFQRLRLRLRLRLRIRDIDHPKFDEGRGEHQDPDAWLGAG